MNAKCQLRTKKYKNVDNTIYRREGRMQCRCSLTRTHAQWHTNRAYTRINTCTHTSTHTRARAHHTHTHTHTQRLRIHTRAHKRTHMHTYTPWHIQTSTSTPLPYPNHLDIASSKMRMWHSPPVTDRIHRCFKGTLCWYRIPGITLAVCSYLPGILAMDFQHALVVTVRSRSVLTLVLTWINSTHMWVS